MYSSLRDFLDKLRELGELVEVEDEVSLDQELPHILREVCYRGGPAVLFTRVRETPLKVVGNLFGTWRRVEIALSGRDPVQAVREFLEVSQLRVETLLDVVRKLGDVSRFLRYFPKRVSRAAVHEVDYTSLGLLRLPAIRQWPREPSRFFTMGITFVKHGDKLNFGYYRLQLIDDRRFIVHWMPWRRSREIAEQAGRDEVEIAVVFGPDPVTMLMAAVPLPPPLDKLLLTGVVRGEGVKLVRGKHVDVEYPADAELVIEAKVKLRELVPEGPFGDHAGVYSPVKPYPIAEVLGVFGREDAVVPVTVTGKPVLEDGNMILFGERVVLPLLQSIMPEVVDLHILPEGVGYITIVSIRKKYPGHAKRVMLLLWALVPVLNKIVIVVDEDVNVRDLSQVMYALAVHVDPKRDILVVPDYATEELDPSTPIPGFGSKLGIDATRKLPEEYAGQHYPEDVAPRPDIVEKTRPVIEKILDAYRRIRRGG